MVSALLLSLVDVFIMLVLDVGVVFCFGLIVVVFGRFMRFYVFAVVLFLLMVVYSSCCLT